MSFSIAIPLFTLLAGLLLVLPAGAAAREPGNQPDLPTALPAGIEPDTVPPGRAFKINYLWEGKPMGKDYDVFVHLVNESGRTMAQDDHTLPWPTKTSTWEGKASYTRRIIVPADMPDGVYRVVVGLWNRQEGRQPLNAGPGVQPNNERGYTVASVRIDADAPEPRLDSDKPKTLDLSQFELTFSDEFDDLAISAYGPIVGKTRWIAHKPDDGNFGDALFTSPRDGFPFTTVDGILRIEARKDESGRWRSGLLCSNDADSNGFRQKYGYFEMRAKMPQGPGTWPAFWLLSDQRYRGPDGKLGSFEIDILEQYGHAPRNFHANYHWWLKDGGHRGVGDYFIVSDMTENFHDYGFYWDEKEMIWYFDGVELWRQPTPPEANAEFYILVNLALGSGWPIDKTPNPSVMEVDHVRVYQKIP